MKKLTILLIAGLALFSGSVNAQSLDELERTVRAAAQTDGQIDAERERIFVEQRNNQRSLLATARNELQAQERRSDALKNEYDVNERDLAELETVLAERLGNLGELFGVVRQVAGETQTIVDNSMVSAQFPNRGEFLSELAQRKELPTTRELRRLWAEMVTEINQSGKVVSFNAPVETPSGEKVDTNVVRVGTFNAIADDKFLVWRDQSQTLQELSRQPASRFQSLAGNLSAANSGSEEMAVDFTRGVILSAVVQSKSVAERLGFGIEGMGDAGTVGYVIMGVGVFGLLLCIWKFLALSGVGGKIRRQLKNSNPDKNNALGRVMAVYTDSPNSDIETLELKLDEAILRETAPLESGLSFIKVLYVVAPLLGLLGTVVGMIETFQQITLFGTGDPKMMAGGISTALITTVLGLVVAIPITLLHAYLQGKSKALIQILEEQAAGIIAKLAEKRDAGAV